MEANAKFPVLSIVAKVVFFVGCLVLLIGIGHGGILFLDFMKLMSTEGAEWYWGTKDIIRVAIFISGTLMGLLTMAIGEIVGVLFAIEKNTRK